MNGDEVVSALREAAEGEQTYSPPIISKQRCADAADLIESLQTQLAESQHREKAAVADLREHADRKCYVCVHRVSGRCMIPERNCAGFYRWQWRGANK